MLLLFTLEFVWFGMLSKLLRCREVSASVDLYNGRRRGMVVERGLDGTFDVDLATPDTPGFTCRHASLPRRDDVIAVLLGREPADRGRPADEDLLPSRMRAMPDLGVDGDPGAVGMEDFDVRFCWTALPRGGRFFTGMVLVFPGGVGVDPDALDLVTDFGGTIELPSALNVRLACRALRPEVTPEMTDPRNVTPLLIDVTFGVDDVIVFKRLVSFSVAVILGMFVIAHTHRHQHNKN